MSMAMLRREREETIEALCAAYPKTFFADPRHRLPLKHNIEQDIEAELARNKNSRLLDHDISDALEWYCSHVGYKRICGIAGSGRIDLRGVVVAKVTEAEARAAN